jgi:hypothetical protein
VAHAYDREANGEYIFHLIGFAGTGKYTIAQELLSVLAEKGKECRLIDNHFVNNPIFSLVKQDGVTPLPQGVWDQVGIVRRAVLNTIRELSPRHWSFIFTNDLQADLRGDTLYMEDVRDLAANRKAKYVPVTLLCEVDELCRRIAIPTRRERLKAVDPIGARLRKESFEVLRVGSPLQLTLDVTSLPPDQAVRQIWRHAAG